MISRAIASRLILASILCVSKASEANEKTKGPDNFDWSKVETQAEQAKHILKTVNAWRGEKDKNGGKKLRIVYFRPKDRKPLKEHTKRWDGIMSDIQDFT